MATLPFRSLLSTGTLSLLSHKTQQATGIHLYSSSLQPFNLQLSLYKQLQHMEFTAGTIRPPVLIRQWMRRTIAPSCHTDIRTSLRDVDHCGELWAKSSFHQLLLNLSANFSLYSQTCTTHRRSFIRLSMTTSNCTEDKRIIPV